MKKHIVLMAATLWVIAGAAVATPLIDTTGSTFGELNQFGEPDTATYGQTFTVSGPETQLDSFSFRFNDHLYPDFEPDYVDFAAYVYAWDGSKATGSQLFASGAMSSTNNGGADGFELFSINTGGIQLVAGQQYVAFLSASQFFDGIAGASTWELTTSDAYAGGNFVYSNNGSDFGSLTTNAWTCGGTCIGGLDVWFIANFSEPGSVPEPATLTLLGLGLAGLGFSRRRKA